MDHRNSCTHRAHPAPSTRAVVALGQPGSADLGRRFRRGPRRGVVYTASVARELPELIDALSVRLGEIVDISVNWSPLEGAPMLNAVNLACLADPIRDTSHQRLMMVTGSRASANLLVVPCRTSSCLAVMVLRQAATLNIKHTELDGCIPDRRRRCTRRTC